MKITMFNWMYYSCNSPKKNSKNLLNKSPDYLKLSKKATVGIGTILFSTLIVIGNTVQAHKKRASNSLYTLPKASTISHRANILYKRIDFKGTIVDKDNAPLPGASIKVKGTTKSTMSDINGKFTINANVGDILIISYTGYQPKEIIVGNSNNISIHLEENTESLNSVVVIGYGTQSKTKVTGAVSTVKMDEILGDRPVSTTSQLLQNAVPGLSVGIGSGQPGASTNLNIRGATSLNTTGNSIVSGGPLILVDNVPFQGGLNLLDPNDIETVTVLKDAGSAAIYGGRSANGVVLITTKKGKANQKTQLNFSNNLIFASPINLPQISSPDDFLKALKDMGTVNYWSGQNVDTWIDLYSQYKADPSQFPTGDRKVGSAIYAVTPTSAMDDLLGNTVPQFQNNLSISGGSEKTNYRISLGAINEKGIIVPEANQDKFNRYNVRSFISSDISKWFTTQLDASYFNSNTISPANNGFADAARFPSLLVNSTMLTASDGTTNINGTPKQKVINGFPTTIKKDDIRLTGRGILKPLPNLTVTGEFTYDNVKTNEENYNKQLITTRPTNYQVESTGNGVYELKAETINYKALNVFANYKKSFGNHNLSILSGYNQEESITSSFSSSKSGQISPNFPSLENATGVISLTNDYTAFSLVGYFGRFNYDYKGKYLLELNGRYDGSSKFPIDHRFGFFPSGSVGWVVSEEDFFKNTLPFMNVFKLRASLGQVGDQSISPYAFTPTLSPLQPSWLNGSGAFIPSLDSPGLISSDFTWSSVKTLDIGVDFAFFNNRLSGSFDWYQRDTEDILAPGAIPLPGVLGTQAPLQNTASLRSKGYEIQLNWADKISDAWHYRISANLYDSKGFITKFGGNPNNLLNTYYVGQQIGEIWGYETDRLLTVDDFMPGTLNADLKGGTLKPGIPIRQGQTALNPGDVLFKDLDGDGIVRPNSSTLNDPGDRKIIGNSAPRYQFGVSGGISYKNIDFSFVLRGVGKREDFIASALTFPNFDGFTPIYQHQLDYWTPSNTDAFYGRLYDNGTGNQSINQSQQSRYTMNAAFLQISNVSLAYTFSEILIKKIALSNLRVFCSVENPYTFSHYPKGLDPSISNISNGLGYPYLRKISFGLNLTF
ncbi:SusC/RagA family TonB-linked outer membrane protein [Pedobacter sp. MW01-1-1]|uniref:SusC/RagA family TonB-linked outer membrane protein n=1 Tax=Pedobacter sp. MW01-1-1 TaxID=3383027 RepID=UPI003FEE3ADE